MEEQGIDGEPGALNKNQKKKLKAKQKAQAE